MRPRIHEWGSGGYSCIRVVFVDGLGVVGPSTNEGHEYTNGSGGYSCIRVVFVDGLGPVAQAVREWGAGGAVHE